MESNNLEYFKKLYNVSSDVMADHQQKMGKLPADLLELILHSLNAQQVYWLGVLSYFNEFSTPFWTSLNSFLTKEKEKIREVNLLETMHDYIELYKFNIQIAEKGAGPSIQITRTFRKVKQKNSWKLSFIFFLILMEKILKMSLKVMLKH